MRARARLRSGLLRRGLAPAGSVAWFLPPLPRPEPLAAGLAARAARAAAGFACKSATSSVAIPSQVTAIAVGVLNAMKIKKYTVLCSWIMIVGLAAAGSAAWGLQAPASRPPDAGGPAPARVEVVEQAKSAGGEAASILSNGGFETGNDPRDQAPDGWRTGAEVEGVTYGWDRTVAHQGRASLKLSKTAKRYFPIAEWSQRVARSGTRPRLKVGGFVKAENATKAILDVQFLDQQGKWSHAWAAYIGAKKSGDSPVTHGWTWYEGVVEIPEGTKTLVVAAQIYGPGEVWFDDVTAGYTDAKPTDPIGR